VTVAASTAIAALLAAPARPARLLGASASAAYLAVDGIEVIAVVAAGAVRLPIALAVAGEVPATGGPEAVRVGGGEVDLGGPRLRPSRWFDPRPRLPGPALREEVTGARAMLAALPSGAAGLDPVAAGLAGLDPMLAAAAVAAGLAGGDAGPALRLLGRGPGLTPAGDDVVAGALAALVLLGAPDPAAVGAVIDAAAGATTLLSAALLRCAARGQVLPQAAELLRALCGGGPVGTALDAVLAVGATSGAALAVGICAGARIAAVA
jgi:hypothetical protein